MCSSDLLRATLRQTGGAVLVEGRFSAASRVALMLVFAVPTLVLLALAVGLSISGVAPTPVLVVLWIATVALALLGLLAVTVRSFSELGDHHAAAEFLRRAFPPSD